MSIPLPEGLHERLVTSAVGHALAEAPDRHSLARVDPADQPHVLARHLYQVVRRALEATTDSAARLTLVNDLVDYVDEAADRVRSPAEQVTAVWTAPEFGAARPSAVRPATPLSEAALLTNARGEPNLGAELRTELDTCDEADLLCAFVKWHGLRLLESELARLRERGDPLRVITTTYMGATERAALDRLVREFGAEVRVQYADARTRLHAKAWMFRRNTGYDTAYVGSSNLSRAALLDGVEWNVRLSAVATPTLLDKFRLTFDTYWSDDSFEPYDPDRDRDRLDDALAEAGGRRTGDRVTISLAGLEVRPYPYQQQMLDSIEAERVVHDRHRNLVVAATGTGKTVLAALDYRRLCDGATRPRLLFVAHRREILEQALRTYREVLADASFGELYVAGLRPERFTHVFASIQSLSSFGVTNIPQDAYRVVVIDEFHHAEAATYRRLLDHLRPNELLGLTATPERGDGVDVRALFEGRIAAELRLWDALGADLLCPFHYFAVADNVDLTSVSWSRGRYDESELANLYTGNHARASIVLTQLRDKVLDPGCMRAIGFCVSTDHAKFMTKVFEDAGLSARTVLGETSHVDREQALRDLRNGNVQILFTVDVLNEGLDVPDIDTVLFLRPTESATIFLQQLGRGLRRTRDKAVLTVLDFVGHHRKEFRFDLKLRALTGQSRRELERDIERGFPFLPSGCQIVMDRQAQQVVLENIRGQVANRWKDLVQELRRLPGADLNRYLAETGVELSDVLRQGQKSWTQLRRDAGAVSGSSSDEESVLLKRMRAFVHVDDETRASGYRRLLTSDASYAQLAPADQRLARMLFFSLHPGAGGFASYDDGLRQLRVESRVVDELDAIVQLGFDEARHTSERLGGGLDDVPLRLHSHYQREEILAAVDYASLSRKPTSVMQGVAYVESLNVDLLFVTLRKSEADFSPTTMYRDYPINARAFHWESQSTTSLLSPTGQRYIKNQSTVLLFVREQQRNEFGTAPYLNLGRARCSSHTGERPIAITWELETPAPSAFLLSAALIEH